MKIRNGFVSNSSSSSFIIASKSKAPPKGKLCLDTDLGNYSQVKPITNEAELQSYFIHQRYYDEDELEENDYYQKCLKLLAEGFTIHTGRVANDNGDELETAIRSYGIGLLKFDEETVIVDDCDW